jgi:hypothetical protein
MANQIETVGSLPSKPSGEEQSAVTPSIQQLISSQGVKPIQDISVFAGLIPDNEIEDFVSEIYRTRSRDNCLK